MNIYKCNWLIKFGAVEARERVEEELSQIKEDAKELEDSNEALMEDKQNLEKTIEVLFEKYKDAVKELKK